MTVEQPILTPDKHIFCIGIGGFGISAIARILLERGYRISGSDRRANDLTNALARDGAAVYIGHDAANLGDADLVIATSAVSADHVEVATAHERGIPVYKRRDILADLMRDQTVIAIAGTHGKTTTTSMIVHILRTVGMDPSFIVGGVMPGLGVNAGVGRGSAFVIEADEYDYMFLGLSPDLIVLTSVEYDHPDFFSSEAAMTRVFADFLARLRPGGHVVACSDYPLVESLLAELPSHVAVTRYGQTEAAAMQIHNLVAADGGVRFDLHLHTGGQIAVNMGAVTLAVPGSHNALNAVAALAACDLHGVGFPLALPALANFSGTGRRFDLRGERDDIIIIDDYAHHPTAIRTTLQAARALYLDRTLWAVWQPHMYSRTRALIEAYRYAFVEADHVLVTDIYAAREGAIDGVDGAWAAAQIHHDASRYSGDLNATTALLLAEVRPHAVIVIMSAGDAPEIGVRFLENNRTV